MMEFLNRMYFMACHHIKQFFTDEDGAVDIVAIVVMIGIAVVIAVVFRTQLKGMVERLFIQIESSATGAVQ